MKTSLKLMLVKLGVAGVVSVLSACGGMTAKPEIAPLPSYEIQKLVETSAHSGNVDESVRVEIGPSVLTIYK